jgi:hypothetical protein
MTDTVRNIRATAFQARADAFGARIVRERTRWVSASGHFIATPPGTLGGARDGC